MLTMTSPEQESKCSRVKPLILTSKLSLQDSCADEAFPPIAEIVSPFSSTPKGVNFIFYVHLLAEIDKQIQQDSDLKENPRVIVIREKIRQSFENHENDITPLWNEVKDVFPQNTVSSFFKSYYKNLCNNPKCSSDELARGYESFFSATLLRKRPDIPAPVKALLQKIIKAIPTSTLGKNKEEVMTEWIRSGDPNVKSSIPVEYFVAQRGGNPPPTIESLYASDNVARVVDFFGYYSFGHVPQSAFRDAKQECYKNIIEPARGERKSRDEKDRLPEMGGYGIQKIPASELHSPRLTKRWRHPHDRDFVDMSKAFAKKASETGIPLACGLSGQVNLHLWGLASLSLPEGEELSADELRTYLVALWATLTGDGGHSLGEMLGAARLVLKYSEDSKTSKKLPPALESALREVVKDIDLEFNGTAQYYDSFFRYLPPDASKWFRDLREESWQTFLSSLQKECTST